MKKCPKCGGKRFSTFAHVVQEWEVDENGNFLKVVDDCSEVTHSPDDMDLWMCAKCYYEAPGYELNEKSV